MLLDNGRRLKTAMLPESKCKNDLTNIRALLDAASSSPINRAEIGGGGR